MVCGGWYLCSLWLAVLLVFTRIKKMQISKHLQMPSSKFVNLVTRKILQKDKPIIGVQRNETQYIEIEQTRKYIMTQQKGGQI